MDLLKKVEQIYKKDQNQYDDFRPGDEIIVAVKVIEGAKTRIQNFQGTCVAIKGGHDLTSNFKVRKISSGVGVERIFPFHSPVVESVKLVTKGKSRRAKHYFLRNLSGKQARIAVDYSRK